MRLRTTIVLICLIFSLVATFYGVCCEFNVAQEVIMDKTYDNFESFAELKKIQIEQFIEKEKEKMEILKTCSLFSEVLIADNLNESYNESYFQIKEKFDNLNLGLGLFNKEGILLVSENNPVGANYSSFVLGNYDLKILDYYDFTRQKYFIAILSPIFNNYTGEKIGFIGFDIEIEKLNEMVMQGISFERSEEIYLINKEYILITPLRFSNNSVFTQKIDTINSKNCFSNKSNGFEIFLDYRGEKSIGTHEEISVGGWCLIVEIEEKELLDKI